MGTASAAGSPAVISGRGRALALVFAAVVSIPAAAAAGVAGSRHDFSGLSFVKGGPCTACHRIHWAPESRALWSRSLAEEDSYFSQSSNPDYIPSRTLLCYDCHINATSAVPVPDGDPAGWTSGREPQDIAFGDGPGDNGGSDSVGYYELSDGSVPTTGAPTDGSPTGGHYWKSEPSGTPDYGRGDKIPCTLCHDPHDRDTGGNEVMLRSSVADGEGGTVTLGTNLRASPRSRSHTTGTGREMCAACHGYSDSGSPVTLWGVLLPSPPSGISDHAAGGAVPCVECHRHSFVTPSGSCEGCHGQGGSVHAGLDGIPGTGDDAPNVITVGGLSVWDGRWWDSVMGGSTTVQQGGHGDPAGQAALDCTDCHDTNLPPGTHMDGTVNSAESGANANENTAHLLASFVGASSPKSDVQVTLDRACWNCHGSRGVKFMDHDKDSDDRVPELPGPVQFGLGLTMADGTALPYPIDCDVSTNAGTAQPNFAPCVSCHNPHGSTTREAKGSAGTTSNFMLRDKWISSSDLCLRCHV